MAGNEYVLGFAELAKKLGYDVVGDPTMPQRTIPLGGFGYTFQLTTKGRMDYTEGGQPMFFEAYSPKA